ncbi:MAG: GNAT family N-acetyltransferase [Dehalococcoidia bacterium]
MTCTIAVQEETFDSLAQRWPELLEKRSEPTFFETPAWQQTWWKEFGDRAQLKLLTVASDDGTLKMLAPFMVNDGVASFLGGTDLVDYHDFISMGNAYPHCLDAVLRAVGEDSNIRSIHLYSVPEDSPTLECFENVAGAAGWQVNTEEEDVAPRLQLPAAWDDYLAGLSKKNRHELRRKLRRLEAAGDVQYMELTEPDAITPAMDDFMALHRMSTPDKAEFMTGDRERFFRKAVCALAEENIARLCFIELDGQRVATSVSFVMDGVKYLYNSGYDPEHRQLSVGLLNHVYNIRLSIEQGLRIFDFMRGDEPYKYHLGGEDRRVYRLVARR